MTRLREWQADCLDRALRVYQNGQRDFLLVATPGAGKTTLASVLCQRLFAMDSIDLVVCVTPSVAVSQGFASELTRQTGRPMTGDLGAAGWVLTYQALATVDARFWERLADHRVLLILDEIHHCSGQNALQANQWGRTILTRVQQAAAHTLLLSGTPWRSDAQPVTLAHYDTGQVQCDYRYSLAQAIADDVCRRPVITLIDNRSLHYSYSDGAANSHTSIAELLHHESFPYQRLLEQPELVGHVLQCAVDRLEVVHRQNPNAAGLVVTSSINHARSLQSRMHHDFGVNAIVVCHQDANSQQTLEDFRAGKGTWLISVGMVSEGTDIPRLQVCAYLSRIRTELYFRQVMGRILRNDGSALRDCYFYTLAEPTLAGYAHRLAEDLPESCIAVIVDTSPDSLAAKDDMHPSDSWQDMASLLSSTSNDLLSSEPSLEFHLSSENPGDESLFLNFGQLSAFGDYVEQLVNWERQFRYEV